jgi:hypothetical protein
MQRSWGTNAEELERFCWCLMNKKGVKKGLGRVHLLN